MNNFSLQNSNAEALQKFHVWCNLGFWLFWGFQSLFFCWFFGSNDERGGGENILETTLVAAIIEKVAVLMIVQEGKVREHGEKNQVWS